MREASYALQPDKVEPDVGIRLFAPLSHAVRGQVYIWMSCALIVDVVRVRDAFFGSDSREDDYYGLTLPGDELLITVPYGWRHEAMPRAIRRANPHLHHLIPEAP